MTTLITLPLRGPLQLMLCCWALLLHSHTMAAEAQLLDRIVAVVEDNVILASELSTRSDQIRQQMRERNNPLPPDDVLQEQVLERMIMEEIELQFAQRAGIRIDDNAVQDTMRNIARQNNLSLNEFQQALSAEGVSYRSLREQIRREMTISQLRQRHVASRIQINEQDIDHFLNSELGRTNLAPDYRLGHILIATPQTYSPDQKHAAEQLAEQLYQQARSGADFAELAARYSAGQQALEGGDLGWRKATQLPTLFADKVLDMKQGDVATPIQNASGWHIIKVLDLRGGSEHIVEQTQVRHILIKPNEIRSLADAKDLISGIRQRLQDGEDSFHSLARTYSDDPGSALEGGDLGWVSPGTMVPEFERMMSNTPEGEISPPFQSQYGWHILQVEARRSQDMSEELRRNRARTLLQRRKFDDELAVWLRESRQNAYVEVRL